MRLRKFRVRAYRCIHDSGEIRVGDLAAFVGRNESGKTTILQALTLFNKEQENRKEHRKESRKEPQKEPRKEPRKEHRKEHRKEPQKEPRKEHRKEHRKDH